MGNPSLYLETSVPSAYYDYRNRRRMFNTRVSWEKFGDYEVYISELTMAELLRIKTPGLRQKLLNLVNDFKPLERSIEADELADEYMVSRIFPTKYRDDALHLAIASVSGIDYLLSWNFEHLVKVRTKEMAKSVNNSKGYKAIEIISPLEV